MSLSHRVLIIGCGSIGERHLRCFQRTGRCEVGVCDTNATLRDEVARRYGVPAISDLEAALASGSHNSLVICTPAHTHLALARQGARHRTALFIEKPLSVSSAGIEETRTALAAAGRFTAVAYVYHSMPWFAEARDFLRAEALGRPLHATVCAGQHFPTFRPAYRDIYYARHEHGGGAIQDALTHLANVMEWMLGPCNSVFCDASHQALEGVTVEDTVNVAARHGAVLASYAMNQFQAPNEVRVQVHCERGSVGIEGHLRRWGVLRHGESDWSWRQTPPQERDDLFIAQANAFLDGVEGRPTGLCTFDEAAQTLRFNEAALRSVGCGQPVALS